MIEPAQLFTKEKEDVLTVLKKEKGCAFLGIRDADATMPESMVTQITPWDSISWVKVSVCMPCSHRKYVRAECLVFTLFVEFWRFVVNL